MLVYQSGIKPKIDKLTPLPSLESKKPLLLFKGDLWPRDLLVKTIYWVPSFRPSYYTPARVFTTDRSRRVMNEFL